MPHTRVGQAQVWIEVQTFDWQLTFEVTRVAVGGQGVRKRGAGNSGAPACYLAVRRERDERPSITGQCTVRMSDWPARIGATRRISTTQDTENTECG